MGQWVALRAYIERTCTKELRLYRWRVSAHMDDEAVLSGPAVPSEQDEIGERLPVVGDEPFFRKVACEIGASMWV